MRQAARADSIDGGRPTELLAPGAGGSLRIVHVVEREVKPAARQPVADMVVREGSAWKAFGVEERRRCRV